MSFTSIIEKGKLSVYDQNYRSEKKWTDHKTVASSNSSYINVEQQEKNDLLRQNRRELKSKDTKITSLRQKLKHTEDTAQFYKAQISSLEYNVNFYKTKLHEECKQRGELEEQIIDIEQALKKIIVRIQNALYKGKEDNSRMMSLTNIHSQASVIGVSVLWRFVKRLDEYINITEEALASTRMSSLEFNKNMMSKIQLQNAEQKNILNLEKENYLSRILELQRIIEDQKQIIEEKDRQISKVRYQGQFHKNMLVTSEKERLKLLNDIYRIGRDKYEADLASMTKAQVSKICLMLYSKVQELQKGKSSLEKRNKKLQLDCKDQYQDLLVSVKNLKVVKEEDKLKQRPKKRMLKKLDSLPVH